ncbi:MAG TPA: permease prefix domain 1-containing protein [Candidatus Acidoferrum sp.]|jgi:hypothetical protein|nr:permease prefix domain 1-containing protein [Candidatus Acidoferrum sp.]
MFNLDHGISKWRQQMAAGGIKARGILDELESHLRDDVEQQVRSGVPQRRAFEAAVQRIGESKTLKREFGKVGRHRARGFLDNPIPVVILAVWLIIRGLGNLAVRSLLFNGFAADHYSAGQVLWASLSIALGIGLLCHRNFWRVCTMAWIGLQVAGNLWYIATQGLSASGYAYAPHIPAYGQTVQYLILGFLPVPYPVFYAMLLFNSAMWFFGLFLLTRPSIRNRFRTVSV